MSEKKPYILPPVLSAKGRNVIEGELAAEMAAKLTSLEYEYNDAIWTILVDPNGINAKDESELQAIQLRLSKQANIDRKTVERVNSASGQEKDAIANEISQGIDEESLIKLTELAEQMRLATIDMLSKAVVACNDTVHPVTKESLIAGGKVAKIQLETLSNWWNPTEKG